ncbi:MAG TPA: DEAD/DEAH box helicase [Parachlamydiaceae bacterium]|nr:DEAD/DEAH box helicase [Parachlamydiaceae bacterium]
MSFKEFKLLPELLRAIEEQGYAQPTEIQKQAIPLILEGNDLLAGSQTGTGKTASFTLPLIQNLITSNKAKVPCGVRCLILTPTRELASQVEESVRTYGKHVDLKSVVVFGGVNIDKQISKLRHGADIVVATPGRLLDLVGQRAINLSHVEILVLDEADRMLDMGFIRDIRKILGMMPKQRQNLLFSATFSNEIKKLANDLLDTPKMIQAARVNSTVEIISQVIHPVDSKNKRALLSFLINSKNWKQVLVFTRTKHGANRLSTQLETDGITSAAIHGNKSQGARTKALKDFKDGAVRVLVATDIAARGLDIDQLPHVVNFDLPNVPEDYVHRIGRTGRAGNTGEAVSLVCIDEHQLLADIERLLKQPISKVLVQNFEPDPTIKAQPIINGRQQAPKPRSGDARGSAESNHPRANQPRSNQSRGNQSRGNQERPAQANANGKPKSYFNSNRRSDRP